MGALLLVGAFPAGPGLLMTDGLLFILIWSEVVAAFSDEALILFGVESSLGCCLCVGTSRTLCIAGEEDVNCKNRQSPLVVDVLERSG